MTRFVNICELTSSDPTYLLIDLGRRVEAAMLAEVHHQLIYQVFVTVIHASCFKTVTFGIQQKTMHIDFVIKFFEVETTQVDDVARVMVRLLVINVHNVVMQHIVTSHPSFSELADLDEVYTKRFTDFN